jgi:D-glycero-alpha-D-manno-heptose-7-phosphate kinase
MIVTRTPFRITLGGGGTDLPAYYRRRGGFVFAAAINKYMVINLNRPVVDDLVRVKYTRSEIVPHRDLLEHEIAREALRLVGIERGVEIVSMADVPAGTGLGSSSCYAVGLLNALHTLQRRPLGPAALAEQACRLEMDVLGKPVGKQDQYMAAFGGLTVLDISTDGRVTVRPARVSEETLEELRRNTLLFYTGTERNALDILAEQSCAAAAASDRVVANLDRIKEMGWQILEWIEAGDLTSFGLALDRHWQAKKHLSSKVTNPRFDALYELARANGALGGKISGAGGGGFFLFYTESHHQRLREVMREAGLREMRYGFDFEGSKVLVNFLDGTLQSTLTEEPALAAAQPAGTGRAEGRQWPA